MSGGTGLGIKTGGSPVLAQAPGFIDGDKLSSAAAWSSIARTGARLAGMGFDALEKEQATQHAAYYAGKEIEAQRTYAEIANKHHDNPTAFDAEWKGFVDGSLSQAEPWAVDSLKKFYGGLGTRGYSNALGAKRSKDEAAARDSLSARLTMADNDLMGLTAAGKAGTPEWQAAKTAYDGIIDSQVSLGLLTGDEAKLKRDELAGRVSSEQTSISARKVYQEQGFDAAVEHVRKDVLENDKLSLSPASKYKAFNRAVSDLRLLEAERKQERAGVVQVSKDLRERIKASPGDYDPTEVRSVMASLQRTGAISEAARLAQEAGIAEATAPFKSGAVPLSQFASTIKSYREGGGAAGLLRTFEGFREQPYWDVNAHRVGYGSDTITRADGSVLRVQPGMRVTQDDAERDLSRRIDETQASIIKDVGQDKWAKLSRNAQAAITSTAYNYGRLPTSVAMAVATGGPEEIAKAIEGLQDHNDGANRDRRLKEAAVVRGSPVPGGTGGSMAAPPLGRVVRAAQDVFVTQAKAMWPAFQDMMKRGEAPSADDFEAIRYAASISGDPKFSQDVQAVEAGFKAGQGLPELSQADGRAAIDQVRRDFQEGGLTITEDTVLKYLEGEFARQQKLATEDPVTFAGRSNPRFAAVGPLDLSSPDAFRAGMQQRVQMAQWTATSQGIAAGSPLREVDQNQIVAALRAGSPQQAGMILSALAAVPSEMTEPLLKQGGLKDAILGMARSGDPSTMTAAYSYLDQEQKRDPLGFSGKFGKETLKDLDVWNVMGRYLPPDQLTAWVKRKNDPSAQEARKPLIDAADKVLEKVTAEDVVSAMDRMPWIPFTDPGMPVSERLAEAPELLRSDFSTLFREYYAELGDESKARDLALKRLGTVWNQSSVNGGRLMRYAPEAVTYRTSTGQAVPAAVNGSTEWIGKQLDTDLETLGYRKPAGGIAAWDMAATAAPVGGDDRADRIAMAARALLSDRQTEEDITAGRAPSYQVLVQDNSGRWHRLERQDGKAFRFMPDRDAAQAEAEGKFLQGRQDRANDAAMAAEAVRRAPPLDSLIDRNAITGEGQ